uniref:Uncharacterized protein n=1 Tax=Staphylococcus phage HS14 TaxID=3056404 RepID=A0AA49X2Q2_9VIRU|nr:MAG: hypothetical protein [Staphylococcus phage HS14]
MYKKIQKLQIITYPTFLSDRFIGEKLCSII